jgi:hypothetical protein
VESPASAKMRRPLVPHISWAMALGVLKANEKLDQAPRDHLSRAATLTKNNVQTNN